MYLFFWVTQYEVEIKAQLFFALLFHNLIFLDSFFPVNSLPVRPFYCIYSLGCEFGSWKSHYWILPLHVAFYLYLCHPFVCPSHHFSHSCRWGLFEATWKTSESSTRTKVWPRSWRRKRSRYLEQKRTLAIVLRRNCTKNFWLTKNFSSFF